MLMGSNPITFPKFKLRIWVRRQMHKYYSAVYVITDSGLMGVRHSPGLPNCNG